MAKLIAIDWDSHQLRIVLAQRHGATLTIEDMQIIPFSGAGPRDHDPELPEEDRAAARRQLIEALSDAKFRGADVLATVRRADVELRLMALPAVPAAELPEIVRMQAMSEFSEFADDWPIDFVTVESTPQETTVLAAALSSTRMADYRRVLMQADARPKALVLRPTATAVLVDSLDSGSRPDVEICLEDLGRELELSVLRAGKPILIRTVQAPRSDSFDRVTFLAQEVKRTTLAARNQLHGDDVQRVVLFGPSVDGESPLGQKLQERLQLPVRVLDPFRDVQVGRGVSPQSLEQRGQFAAAIGLLVGKAGEDSALIDFLHPRQVERPKSPRRIAILAVSGILLITLVAAGGFFWKLRSMDAEARRLQARVQNQRRTVEAAETRIGEVAAIEQWQRGNVDWLTQLSEISAAIPGPDQARFLRWQATLLNDGNGQITLNGVVDQQQTIGAIDRALRGKQRRVRTAGGDYQDREPGLPWQFKQTITVETQPTPAVSPQRGPPTSFRSPPRRVDR